MALAKSNDGSEDFGVYHLEFLTILRLEFPLLSRHYPRSLWILD